PIRGRRSKTSTVPSTSPRMPATPVVGWIRAAAICSRVVLPAPLGPITTQRSPSSTDQSMSCRSVVAPRRTPTPANSRTSLMSSKVSLPAGAYHHRMADLPASVRVALWGTAALAGRIEVRDVPACAMPDLDPVDGLVPQLDLWRDLGERLVLVALPR